MGWTIARCLMFPDREANRDLKGRLAHLADPSVGSDFAKQRNAGMVYIALGFLAAVALWLLVNHVVPPLPGMESLSDRMLFTLKCCCVAVLFSLVAGVEAVAHERLSSPAFDPLAGFQTLRLRVNQRYLKNTVEQTIVFVIAVFGLAAYSPTGASMRRVLAFTLVWVLARLAFWIGYHQSAAMRGLGAPGMAISMIVLLYVASRFGNDIAGTVGAMAPVALFLALEGFLFWATRPLKPA
jgi:hypothetical protein